MTDSEFDNRMQTAPPGSGRERMLAAARRLFIERGYSDVSMQQIADAAGLRKASLYHHVKDKQSLFTEVVLTEMRQHRAAMEEVIGGVDLRVSLEAIARIQFTQYQTDMAHLAREFRAQVPESEHDEIHAELEAMTNVLTGVFERALGRGQRLAVRPNVAGLLFFHMITAWTFHAMDDSKLDPGDPEDAARTVTRIFLDGALTDPR